MQKYKNRDEVPEKYKWDLTSIFKDEKEFNNSLKKCKELIKELKEYVGCTKDPKKLYEYLEKEIEAVALWEDLYVYSYLINDQELGKEESVVRKNKTEQLNIDLDLNTSFFAPELLKLSKDEYNDLFKKEERLLIFKA